MDAGLLHYSNVQGDSAIALQNTGFMQPGPVKPQHYPNTPSADTAAEDTHNMHSAAPSAYGTRQPQPQPQHGQYLDPATNAAQVSAAQALGAQAFGNQAFPNQAADMPFPHQYNGQTPSMADNYNHSAYGAFSSVSQRPANHRKGGHPRPAGFTTRPKSHRTDGASVSAKSGVRSSTTEKTPVDQDRSRSLVPNGLGACTADSVKTMAMECFLPVLMMAGACLMHHTGHTKSPSVIPFNGSKWYKRVNNALYAISSYFFFKRVGVFNQGPDRDAVPAGVDGTRSLAVQKAPAPQASGRHARTARRSQTEARRAVDTESLFAGKGAYSSLVPSGELHQQYQEHLDCLVNEFDGRWAVPRAVAKHYYNEVYRNKGGLNNANAEVMGGAAAIRAVRKVAWHAGRHEGEEASDRAVMDCALTEVADLLARKAAVAPLAADEVFENVGRFALATIIQIKVGAAQDTMCAQ